MLQGPITNTSYFIYSCCIQSNGSTICPKLQHSYETVYNVISESSTATQTVISDNCEILVVNVCNVVVSFLLAPCLRDVLYFTMLDPS
jgi:hypothetical protein